MPAANVPERRDDPLPRVEFDPRELPRPRYEDEPPLRVEADDIEWEGLGRESRPPPSSCRARPLLS